MNELWAHPVSVARGRAKNKRREAQRRYLQQQQRYSLEVYQQQRLRQRQEKHQQQLLAVERQGPLWVT